MMTFNQKIKSDGIPFPYCTLPEEVGVTIGSFLESGDGSHPDQFMMEVPSGPLCLFCVFATLSPNVPLSDFDNWIFYLVHSCDIRCSGRYVSYETIFKRFTAVKWGDVADAVYSEMTKLGL